MRPCLFQSAIQVSKNFVYEEPDLLENLDYQSLKRLTQKLDKTIKNSHDVVAFWMVQMNQYTAKHMKSERFGIFRTVQSKSNNNDIFDPDDNNDDLPLVVRLWEQQLAGEYVVYSNKLQNLCHTALGCSQYVHITSPIRRMVDLLNQIAWVKHHIKEVVFSDSLNKFYENQLEKMPELNDKMKKIRKIQSDAHILNTVVCDPHILSRDFKGIVLAKGDHSTVYIEDLKWITQCKIPETKSLYETVKCKIFVFENEEQMRKKIRVQVVED